MTTDLCKPIPIGNILNMTHDCQPANVSIVANSVAGESQPSPSAAVDIIGRYMLQTTLLVQYKLLCSLFLYRT